MRFLIDTHVWLWLQTEPGRLSTDLLDQLRDTSNEALLSAASCWEIAIKYALGKLPLPEPPGEYVPSRMAASGTTPLHVTHDHALHVATLPTHHRDPFDRLLVAQAQLENLSLLTADPAMAPYDVNVLSAT